MKVFNNDDTLNLRWAGKVRLPALRDFLVSRTRSEIAGMSMAWPITQGESGVWFMAGNQYESEAAAKVDKAAMLTIIAEAQ